jgi:hypothetical protein
MDSYEACGSVHGDDLAVAQSAGRVARGEDGRDRVLAGDHSCVGEDAAAVGDDGASGAKSSDHAGLVIGQTSTSPGRSCENSDSSRITRTGPVCTPGDPATPAIAPWCASTTGCESSRKYRSALVIWRNAGGRPRRSGVGGALP